MGSRISGVEIVLYGLPFVFLFAFIVQAVSFFSPGLSSRILRLMGEGAVLLWGLAVIAALLRLFFALSASLLGGSRRF
jgi:hypothetical protein